MTGCGLQRQPHLWWSREGAGRTRWGEVLHPTCFWLVREVIVIIPGVRRPVTLGRDRHHWHWRANQYTGHQRLSVSARCNARYQASGWRSL